MSNAEAMLQYPDFLTATVKPGSPTEVMKDDVKAIKRTKKLVQILLPKISPGEDDKSRVLEALNDLQSMIEDKIKQRRRGPKEQYNLNAELCGLVYENLKTQGKPCYEEVVNLIPAEIVITARDVEQRVKRTVAKYPDRHPALARLMKQASCPLNRN